MANHNLMNILRKPALIPLFLACCTWTACQQDDDLGDRRAQNQPPVIAIPPIDLLAGNCEIASHVALVDASEIEIAEEIHADDGSLGYVVEKVSAALLRSYKGDFGDAQQVVYYAFLEYPTAPESTRLDTLLVFLKEGGYRKGFSVIEVGQFRFSDSLGRIIEGICHGR